MVKFLWDECIPPDFAGYIYKNGSYNAISNRKLTYQKANAIVKNFIEEDVNRINFFKYKIEKSFNLIHYIYSSLFSKIYNRINNFRRKQFWFCFCSLESKKTKQWTYCSKDNKWVPNTYKTGFGNRYVIKGKRSKRLSKQAPLYFEKSVLEQTRAIASAPKYRMTAETAEIKKEIGIDKPDGTKTSTKMDGFAKKFMGATAAARAAKRRNERKKNL